ncbi:MAG: helicase-related protein [Thermodesulfovibrio sp.]|nr:helicase-related protein [Thermodesulfovibrio sp.]MDW7972791.1 helicase-related protein [Thermodesulfovibrio sp.]
MKTDNLLNKKIILPTHFADPVEVESINKIDTHYKLLVRRTDGYLEEIVLSPEELNEIQIISEDKGQIVDAEQLALLIESYRIRHAYSYDPYFAVSLSGIQTLPHQIEAVYGKMLPQPRLRFLLADDPGAGKTIMAGLLIKELKMRWGIEKILIIVPANLRIQWQDDLLRFFNEYFIIIDAELDRQQAVNIWQKENQIIVSIDYAKQIEVRDRVWQQNWDIVIVDEAHKCSAHTKRRSDRSPERETTKRYQLVEKLSQRPNHLLLLTATPHYGDDDRFSHFLRLLDPDIFPEPHKFQNEINKIRNLLFPDKDNPWILRRLKEDLYDLQGRPLFTKRHTITISFRISLEEYELYETVTDYLNRFLALKGTGRVRQSIALTRTVFQRRLASSTYAIFETLKRRLQRQKEFLDELESLPPKERNKLLEKRRGIVPDEERDDSDLDEQDTDRLTDEFTAATEIAEIRDEIEYLKELVEKAKNVYEKAPDTKLNTLKECLDRTEFAELKDGRGKLLIFTEHRDTLFYLKKHIEKWGYSTCEIYGQMDVYQRKKAQEDFRTNAQICIATEAAGEGINLQFCHLVINYDIPWNPARLEQRMGRVHRIGQKRDVYVFNFVADEAINGKPIVEGKVLRRLLEKMERMREALGADRVYDVIGEILSLNKVDLSEILREAAYNPHRLEEYLEIIEHIDPEKLKKYEEMTGIALARAYIDFSGFQRKNFEAEEKRLMPEYVERYFKKAGELLGLKIERRADGLLRIPHVPADFRSDSLESVRHFGKPEDKYRKITFHKEHLERDQHVDAVLISPGHPLYAVVDEKLTTKLRGLKGKHGILLDLNATEHYWIHYLELTIIDGKGNPIYKELSAIRENKNGEYFIIPTDIIHDLAPFNEKLAIQPNFEIDKAKDYLMVKRQLEKRQEILKERQSNAKIVRDYLEKSFNERIYSFERKIMEAKAKGESEEDIKKLENEWEDLHRIKEEKIKNVNNLSIVRNGPVNHIASFFILPAGDITQFSNFVISEEEKEKSEKAAMKIVMQYEIDRGWEPEDVSNSKIGFDIRSLGPPDPKTGYREVRRIEVKGRKKGENIRLTVNEWLKAKQLKDTYWLYVVWNPNEANFEIVTIQNPALKLEYAAKEIKSLSHYEIDGREIDKLRS